MYLDVTEAQAKILREALHMRLTQLERELVRTDSRPFRRELREAMDQVEALLHVLTFRTEAESTYA